MARRRIGGCLIALLLIAGAHPAAQRSLEYEVKAAYLYNIVNFVTWPPDAFTSPGDFLHICVYGTDPFGPLLDRTMLGGTANRRPIAILRIDDPEALRECQVVFLPGGNTDRIDQAVRATAGRPALTVGEAADFLRRGGIIGLAVDGGRVRLDINLSAASGRHLVLSSRLLQVARVVAGRGRAE